MGCSEASAEPITDNAGTELSQCRAMPEQTTTGFGSGAAAAATSRQAQAHLPRYTTPFVTTQRVVCACSSTAAPRVSCRGRGACTQRRTVPRQTVVSSAIPAAHSPTLGQTHPAQSKRCSAAAAGHPRHPAACTHVHAEVGERNRLCVCTCNGDRAALPSTARVSTPSCPHHNSTAALTRAAGPVSIRCYF